jgi:CheY-like chemotaxis protein
MKRYKVLLTGKNKTAIDDFFYQMGLEFESLTTSDRLEDMTAHIDIFEPDIFVYCLNGETREDFMKMKELKRYMTKKGIVTVVIGTDEDCENFNKVAVYMADLTLLKPITANAIKQKIIAHMEAVEKEQEEQRILQARLAELQAKNERKHVLVIDDDPMLLKLIKEHLHEKYDVATAISGKIAHKFLETKKTNFILLDYEMPVENGPEVLRKIRENHEFDDIPVVFLTGITDREKIKEALMLKPQGYLLKPIDKDKLLGTVEKFIG